MHNVQHYISLLETTAVITTILQYLSGALICRKFIKKKSTGDSSGLPFICGFLSCGFWLHYGFLSGEHSVMFVNIIGVMLFFVYILIYYVITVNKKSHIKQFLCILFILIAVIAYVNSLKDYEQSQRIMGIVCCVVTVCFFAAPLINLFHVIRIKNSESLPFPLIIMSFLVSTQWLIYGIVISDTYIQLTNFLGCLLSMLQLCLFVCYPPKTFNGQGYKLVEQSVVF